IPRGFLNDDESLYGIQQGDPKDSTKAKTYLASFPFSISAQMLDRGEERYNIFCAPCHAQTGAGDGMVVRRGYRKPPSLHQDRLRNEKVGYFFDVITNGFGVMPSYADQIPVRDRWAIVAYIKALQLSQNANYVEIPQDKQAQLGPATGAAPAATPAPSTNPTGDSTSGSTPASGSQSSNSQSGGQRK
ncbi:MAG TPA: cytochrome c, partial [Candidatus Kapabacteria bacterium]|nr:cytochrome c [Candidatus Kapabacteria bacterium]